MLLKGQCHQKCAPFRPSDILIKPKLAGGNWFHIFLSLCCNDTIFKRLVTRSKSRREMELQQGTPEVLKNLWNWKYSANEIIKIKNWTNQRRGFEEFSSGSSLNFRSARYGGAITRFYIWCGFTEVHYICTWHSGCLICTSGMSCCSSISSLFLLLVNKLLKNPTAVWRNRKLRNSLPSTSLGLICGPVCLSRTHFWWHCPFKSVNVLLNVDANLTSQFRCRLKLWKCRFICVTFVNKYYKA